MKVCSLRHNFPLSEFDFDFFWFMVIKAFHNFSFQISSRIFKDFRGYLDVNIVVAIVRNKLYMCVYVCVLRPRRVQ